MVPRLIWPVRSMSAGAPPGAAGKEAALGVDGAEQLAQVGADLPLRAAASADCSAEHSASCAIAAARPRG